MELGLLVGLTLLALLALAALLVRGSDPSAGPLWPRLESVSRLDRITLVVALLVVVTIVGTVSGAGWRAGWGRLGVRSTLEPSFNDARVITTGAELVRAGLDPLDVTLARDPRLPPMNYPRVWHLLGPLGVDDGDTVGLALVFVAAAGLGLLAFTLRQPDGLTRALLGVGAISPAVLLGVERGNNDLLIFGLVSAAVLALPAFAGASLALLVAAHVLKLFPLAAFGCLLGAEPRRRRLLLVCGGLAVGVHLVLVAGDLAAIGASTERGTIGAFGAIVVPLALRRFELLPVAFGLALGAVGLAAAARWRAAPVEGDPTRLAAFRAGAGTYLGAFLIGPCWDYRLMFLLFTFPQLLAWARTGPRRALAGGTLTLALLSQWSDLGFHLTGLSVRTWFFLDEGWNWGLYVGLAWLLLASTPRLRPSGTDDVAPGGEAPRDVAGPSSPPASPAA